MQDCLIDCVLFQKIKKVLAKIALLKMQHFHTMYYHVLQTLCYGKTNEEGEGEDVTK